MGSNSVDAAGCSETTVEIKIKTLDSQTFTLRVDKCVPVPQLKEQIASLTGVISEQQRLICRGKVLKDDQLLSAYHVEDGHTLHLVVRQPIVPSPELSDHPATDSTSSMGQNPRVMVGTFNLSDQGDGSFPDLNRIVSAVLGSFGVARSGIGGEGIDLNQTPLERLFTASGLSGAGNSVRPQSDQVESLQPPIIPDSLTTLLQYASHLRQAFIVNAGGQDAEAAVHSGEPRGILRPESLAEVMSSARQLLVDQASGCLSQLAGQLESHSSVTDPLERSRIQTHAIRSGVLFQNLGALFLELGRTIMTMRMGQTPADALVNAGPSVFVSSTGPNPIMVQPLPFQPGASLSSVSAPPGLAGGSAAAATTGFVPRNIDIRIRTGSSLLSRREPSSSPQPANPGPQVAAAAAADPNLLAPPPQVRAVPLRSVVAGVPAAGRSTDTSRGSIGFLYPVLARVQHVSSLTSNLNRAPSGQTQDSNNANTAAEQPPPPQHQNFPFPGGSEALLNDQGFAAHIRGGLEQLFSTLFPGEHFLTSNPTAPAPPAAAAAAPTPAATQESAPVSEEGILLSNILRQIMPMIPQNNNTGAGSNEAETQADDDGNPDRASSSRNRPGNNQSQQPDSKRQKRE